jgi:FMN-dependent NADH-azoreductase
MNKPAMSAGDMTLERPMSSDVKTILHIDASARKTGSVTRELTETLVKSLATANRDAKILTRDVSQGLPFIDETWVGATFTDPAERTPEQRLKLAVSDTLVSELKAADVVVIGTPIYNFSVPAALKAWIDQVARARETFQYTENGPVGLLKDKKAIIAVASGGTQAGSDIDFATTYLKHFLGFLGITDVTVIAADQLMVNPDKRADAISLAEQLAA